MKRPVPKALRINCPGWYDPSTQITYGGGDILRGPQISGRLLTAYYEREKFMDRTERKERLVCEEVYVSDPVPADQELRADAEVHGEAPSDSEAPPTTNLDPTIKPEKRGPGRPAKE